jgi:hypothetical protein
MEADGFSLTRGSTRDAKKSPRNVVEAATGCGDELHGLGVDEDGDRRHRCVSTTISIRRRQWHDDSFGLFC